LHPTYILRYFNGKRRAEQAVLDSFQSNGFVLRPGFMYGNRALPAPLAGVTLPLGFLGR
jgi:hypothetical protein